MFHALCFVFLVGYAHARGIGFDFIAVSSVDPGTNGMIRASATTWRRDIPGVYAVDSGSSRKTECINGICDPADEIVVPAPIWVAAGDVVWAYPDHPTDNPDQPGLARSIAALRLANQSFAGQYDWILYGDVSTVFFVDRITELLEGLDPNIPYVISDSIMGTCSKSGHDGIVPIDYASYCLLPNVAPAVHHAHPECVRNPAAAPCTPLKVLDNKLCYKAAMLETIRERVSSFPVLEPTRNTVWLNETHQITTGDGAHYHYFDTKNGVIISRGLMEAVTVEEFVRCEQSPEVMHGNTTLSSCLWSFGYATTNPTDVAQDRQFGRCAFGRFDSNELNFMMSEVVATRNCSNVADIPSYPNRPMRHNDLQVISTLATTYIPTYGIAPNPLDLHDLWNARADLVDFASGMCFDELSDKM